jgi:hypothetical protein
MTVRPDPLVSELATSFDGELIGPSDAGYDTVRQPWNGMVDKRPALIARPRGTADVAAAVRFARAHDRFDARRPPTVRSRSTLTGSSLWSASSCWIGR